MKDNSTRYLREFSVRWADCDFNGHMRHSAFNDYAAHMRVSMFKDFGLPMEKLMAMRLGPVLFREETNFYRELRLDQIFKVDCAVIAMRHNGKIFKMHHHFFNDQDELAAEIVVEGSWMDLDKRKVATPPAEVQAIINTFPRAEEFTWLPDKRELPR